MSRFGEYLRHKAADLVRSVSLTSTNGWSDPGSHAGESVSEARLLSLSPGWACVNLIAGVTGTLPFGVVKYNPTTQIWDEQPDHWLSLLFDNPNPYQTSVDILEFIAASLEFRGNAYLRKSSVVSSRVASLTAINPAIVAARWEGDRIRYRYTDDRGRAQDLDMDDIWHVRGFGGSPLGGLSTIEYGRHAFGLSLAIDKSAATTFRNGVRPAGVLKFKEWLKGEKREAAHAKLLEEHAGAMNQGKPLVLEGGVEWQQISFSPEDSQLLQSRTFSVEEVCRFFAVPPVLIGHTEKVSAWGSGISEITLGFVKYAMRRRLKRIEKSAAKFLLSARERGEGYALRFNLEGLLRGDEKARAAFYQTMTQIGAYEIDRVRRLENIPPLPNGAGSVPRLQMQNVPLTSLNVSVGSQPTAES